MRYASICDGIGAVHVAWKPLGWECAWTAEIEPFPAAVVEHHHGLPNLGDMTRITDEQIEQHGAIDLIAGGTPCQSFSVAGLRKGLDDPRGNLALVFLGLAERTRALWLVWENVPGVLSSGGGRDFGSFLGALGELGYGFAWRSLDAQFFGVPQRRRRVFVVGHLGDWRPPAAVLLERESLSGHPQARRGPRQEVARSLTASTGGASGKEQQLSFVSGDGRPLNPLCFGGGNTSGEIEVATCLTHHHSRQDFDTETFAVVGPLCANVGAHGHTGGGQQAAPACTTGPVAGVAYSFQPRIGRSGRGQPSEVVSALAGAGADAGATSDSRPCVAVAGPSYAVRRLTPRECERLQGFPDDYTLIEFRGKPASDGARYRAIGNSMAVPVMAWIGKRIQMVERASFNQ